MSGCAGSRAIKHLQIECISETEYRRVNLPAKMKRTKIVGLTPWTHFDVQVTVFDSLGGYWKSRSIKLMTRRAGERCSESTVGFFCFTNGVFIDCC